MAAPPCLPQPPTPLRSFCVATMKLHFLFNSQYSWVTMANHTFQIPLLRSSRRDAAGNSAGSNEASGRRNLMRSHALPRRMPVFVAAWMAVLVGLTALPTSSRAQTIEWIRQFGTSAEDQATGVARDSTGVYVSGFTWGVLPGQTNAGLSDAYVRKHDPSGNE